MKWTQLAVVIFFAIQQSSCTVQEHQLPLLDVEEVDLSLGHTNEDIESGSVSHHRLGLQDTHRYFSSLYKHPKFKKMTKVIKINDPLDDLKVEIDQNNVQESHFIKSQDSSNLPLEKRSKMKGALLLAGGAALGALGMKHFSKPSGGGQVDPNAGAPAK